MRRSTLLTLGPVMAGLLTYSGAVQAQTRDVAMPIGRTVAAPSGFIALCEASPVDCAGADRSPQTLTAVRSWAAQTRWSQVFAAAGLSTASPQTVVVDHPATAPASIKGSNARDEVRAQKDAARKVQASSRKRRTKDGRVAPALPAPAPRSGIPPLGIPQAPPPTQSERPTVEILQGVNRQINRAVRRSSDQDAFGQADVWQAAVGPRARGDCEDYVLAKRRALIEAGVNPASLSIALVRTRRGEAHAVLLAATEDGEYVLDNLSPWVVRWDAAPYEWLERQAPGSNLTWVRAGHVDARSAA